MAFNEDSRVKIPTILHLTRLGYGYLSLKGQKWDETNNIFTDIFKKSVHQINKDRKLTDGDVNRLLYDVQLSLENEDLGNAFYQKLVDQAGTRLIDFENFDNNTFNVVTELTCKKDDEEFRPDITLLINGMPLVFIEVVGGGLVSRSILPGDPAFLLGCWRSGKTMLSLPMLGEKSPDFVVLLSFEKDLHQLYPREKEYLLLCEELASNKSLLDQGWQFYNHLKDDAVTQKNFWHPLYLRKPLLEVLRGTTKAEEQEQRFMQCAEEVIPAIVNSPHFKSLRTQYSNSLPALPL